MIKNIILVLKTVKYLKKKQLLYLIYRRIKFNFVSKKINSYKINKITLVVKPIYKTTKLTDNNNFKFLNIERKIDLNLDWNCKNYEKQGSAAWVELPERYKICPKSVPTSFLERCAIHWVGSGGVAREGGERA